MKERLLALRPLLLKIVGYPSFFVFWFLLFVYVTFPYDRLKEAVVAAVEAPRRQTGGTVAPSNMQLTIDELHPTFLPGVRAKNAVLTFLPTREGDHAITMRIQSLVAHVGLFSLLGGNLNADIDLEGMGGTAHARIDVALGGAHPGLREIHATLNNLRASDLAPLVAMVGLPLGGNVSGTVDLRLPDSRSERATGTLRLAIDNLRIGDGVAQYQTDFGGLTVETIRAGRLEANLTLDNGNVHFDRVAAHSNEFQFSLAGHVQLAQVVSTSDIDAHVQFQLTDAYRDKSPLALRIVDAMSHMQRLQQARRSDGTYAFYCRGPMDARMRCPPDTAGVPASRPHM